MGSPNQPEFRHETSSPGIEIPGYPYKVPFGDSPPRCIGRVQPSRESAFRRTLYCGARGFNPGRGCSTGSGTIERYGDATAVDVGKIKTYPEAGQLQEEIRWTPNPRPQDPGRVELSFASFKRELRTTNGSATYFMMPTEVAQARKQGQLAQPLHQWLQLSAKASSLNVGGGAVSTTD